MYDYLMKILLVPKFVNVLMREYGFLKFFSFSHKREMILSL